MTHIIPYNTAFAGTEPSSGGGADHRQAFRRLTLGELHTLHRQYEDYIRWHATCKLAHQLFGPSVRRIALAYSKHTSDDGSHYSIEKMCGYDAEGGVLSYDFTTSYWQQPIWDNRTLLDAIDNVAGTVEHVDGHLSEEVQARRQDAALIVFAEDFNAYDSLPIHYEPSPVEVDLQIPPPRTYPEIFVPISSNATGSGA